ncbi:MAG: methyltransferase, partial [Chloroflexota bacterium]
LLETVAPEELFGREYPYYSSFSDTLVAHARQNVLTLIERRGLSAQSFVVEIASNDGYLLQHFIEQGIPVLGIDPAEGPVQVARARGIPTLCAFFGRDLAE